MNFIRKVIMGIVDKINKDQNGVSLKNVNLTEQEIEFLLYLFGESMIPGKKLAEAVSIIEKLQNTYKDFQKEKVLK
tara:strand:- start:343 stop:570 length:228 start_codon:yes stop_codon:yes gene_type:complete